MNKQLKYIIGVLTLFVTYIVFYFDFYSSFGVAFFVFFGVKIFIEIGNKIEIRDIIILLATLQWIIGPLLAYKIYPDDEFYYMAVNIDTYMGFVVPATFMLVLGLYIPLWKKISSDDDILGAIKLFVTKYKNIDIILISIGIVSELIIDIVPQSIRFVLFLFSGLRFIGLYFLFLSNRKNKIIYVSVLLLWLFLSAIKEAMFHDLLLWLIFFMMIVGFIVKPKIRKKVMFLIIFLFLIISIQTVKHSFREALHEGSGEGLELFANLVQEEVGGDYVTSESNLSAMVTRINQGWIIARIMHWTPSREPFANGETIYDALKTAFMPRFLFPNKIKAGGRTYFTRFTGKDIREDTSMGLSLLGEAYANYGIYGGFFFMFLIGLFYNLFIKKIYRIAIKHPAIIFFIPLIFQQVVKAETDFSVIINHLFKASVAVWLIFWGLKTFFKIRL